MSGRAEKPIAAQRRDLLAAIVALVGLPHPASHEERQKYYEALSMRAACLCWALDGPMADPGLQLGPGHPDTLTTRNNLAGWTGRAGNAAAARDQYAELLPIRERVFGADHRAALFTHASLASWTGEAGDAAGARDQYTELLPIFERFWALSTPTP